MALEQSGPLTSLFANLRRKRAKNLHTDSRKRKSSRPRFSQLEQLEERRMMISHVFVDFGDRFAVQTAAPYAGLRVVEDFSGPEFMEHFQWENGAAAPTYSQAFGLLPGAGEIDLMALGDVIQLWNPIDVDGDGLAGTANDVTAVKRQIMSSIRRALEPFDIGVFEVAAPGSQAMDIYDFIDSQVQSNNTSDEGGSATVPQFGSDDIYIFVTGTFIDPGGIITPLLTPMSATFGVNFESIFSPPNRSDAGAIIDVNYWIDRVAGAVGTGHSLNTALYNAAMYTIGWGYGLSEIENGKQGPFTHFVNKDIELLNRSSAMLEAGFTEFTTDYFDPDGVAKVINTTHSTFFNRFDMMQNGTDFQLFLKQGVLGNPPPLVTPPFPLPPEFTPIPETLNVNPNRTVNLYDLLVNDRDIGRNPDAEYVTGTGAYDRIFIRSLSGNRAKITVEAYRDSGFTQLIGKQEYTINLKKIVTPGRANSAQPFRLIVEGCNANDQIFLDPDLATRVIVHGGPNVERLKIKGNSSYNVKYTPDAPAVNPDLEHFIPEGMLRESSGVLVISGKFGTTTVVVDNFNPNNASAIQLENFNRLHYQAPGYLDMDLNITVPRPGEWNVAGQVANDIIVQPGFPPIVASLTGNLQFTKLKRLYIDTAIGATNDEINFATDATLSSGLQSVHVQMGAGNDQLRFNDSNRLADVDYFLSPTAVAYGAGVSSKFSAYTYSGVQTVTLRGTQGNNDFVAIPGKVTRYIVHGDDPGAPVSNGDSLAIRRSGTSGATLVPNGVNNGTWTFSSGHRDVMFSSIEEAVLPPSIVAVSGASDTGKGKPLVKVYEASTNDLLYSFFAYPQSFRGGVRVAVADVNGDSTPDIIVAPGAGRSEVKVYDGAIMQLIVNGDGLVEDPSLALLDQFSPEGSSYKNGLFVATGDIDGDGDADIVTSRSRGETQVRVFENNGTGNFDRLVSWRPYSKSIISGAALAVADINKDGLAEVITAPGAGQKATVKVFSGFDGQQMLQFDAFESSFRNGVSLAAGDVDGDGRAEIMVGAGTGGGSRVRVFSRTGALKSSFKAYTSGNVNAPLRIAAVDPDGADRMMLFVGQGNDGKSHRIRLFDPLTGRRVDEFVERDPAFEGGVFLG